MSSVSAVRAYHRRRKIGAQLRVVRDLLSALQLLLLRIMFDRRPRTLLLLPVSLVSSIAMRVGRRVER